jgi:hypothetical protein
MAKKPKTSGSPTEASDGISSPTGAAGHRAPKSPPLTDAERHKRFVDMAREVEASEKAEDFDKVFEKVTAKPDS